MTSRRRGRTLAAALFTCLGAFVALAGAAEAHVSVSSADAVRGGYAVLTFRVPTESDTASTTKLTVALPTDRPLAFVAVQPHAGWTFTVKKTKLTTPITTDDGPVTEAISEIDWTATSGAIKPGEFDQFNIEVGPLPNVATVSFPAVQTYSDGSVVRWIEQSSPGSSAEPEHPAPTLTLGAAPSTSAPSASPSVTAAPSDSADGKASTGLATTGIVLGGVGVVLGAVGIGLAARRRRA